MSTGTGGSPERDRLSGAPLRLGVVGSSWRAGMHLDVATATGLATPVGVVTRSAERGAEVTARWGVPVVRSVAELLDATEPEAVLVAVPREAAPALLVELARAEVPTLTETPPAGDLQAARSLWDAVGHTDLVQVAEHMPFLPDHVATAAVVRGGAVGQVTEAQVSGTHEYHSVAALRHLLGAGRGPVTVRAVATSAPLAHPVDRGGWTADAAPRPTSTAHAVLTFADGTCGVHEYVDGQWRNPLRASRLLVRGSTGEVADGRVTRLVDATTVVTSRVERTYGGLEHGRGWADLHHLALDGQVLYRNPLPGAPLSDDDLAIAGILDALRSWVRDDGDPPYPLADGLHDLQVGLAIRESARTDRAVTTGPEAWSSR